MSHPLQDVWNPLAGQVVDFERGGIVTRVHSIDGKPIQAASRRKVAPARRSSQNDFVDALGHGLSLLECWGEGDLWLTNAELAARSGLNKSTVSRLSSVLVGLGYLARESERGRLRLAAATLELGFGSPFAAESVAEAHAELSRLAVELDVYAALSVRRIDKVQVLDNVVSPLHPDAIEMDVGALLPLCRSASGLAAIAALPDAEVAPLITRLRSHYGPRWEALQRQLSRTRQEFSSRGYCSSVAGLSRNVAAVAIPVVAARSADVYVIGCGMPATEFHRERVEQEIVPQMQRMARELAEVLGR
jgi:DNA-binding IclR family transcriptional regulator